MLRWSISVTIAGARRRPIAQARPPNPAPRMTIRGNPESRATTDPGLTAGYRGVLLGFRRPIASKSVVAVDACFLLAIELRR